MKGWPTERGGGGLFAGGDLGRAVLEGRDVTVRVRDPRGPRQRNADLSRKLEK